LLLLGLFISVDGQYQWLYSTRLGRASIVDSGLLLRGRDVERGHDAGRSAGGRYWQLHRWSKLFTVHRCDF
jgi:hypothetical protein